MNTTLAVLFTVAIFPGTQSEKVLVAHYSIEVPAGHRLRKTPTDDLADFDLYTLTSRDGMKTLCTLYFGNAPRFPIRKWEGKPAETKDKGRTKRAFRSANALEGVITFSGLTYADSPFTPFGTIHYFSVVLDPEEVKVVQRLVDSIHVVRPHID